MAIAQVGSATSVSFGAGSTAAPGTPTGVVAGHVLVLVVTIRGSQTITTPTGWTLAPNTSVQNGTANSDCRLAVYYRVADGGANDNPTVTVSAATRGMAGMVAFSGVDNTTPVDVSNAQANASSANVVAPSITTTVANAMLVFAGGMRGADTTSTPPTGMTELLDANTAGNTHTITIADVIQVAAGATGTETATFAAANLNCGGLLALVPATGGGGPTPVKDVWGAMPV